MSKTPDMTEKEFQKAIARNGGEPRGFMGYIQFEREDGANISISRLNYGSNRRRQLAELLKARDAEFDKWEGGKRK